MKYVSATGATHYYKSEPKLIRRTLQLASNAAEDYEVTDIMDAIWLVAGNLVQEVKAQPIYHREDGKIVKAFDIIFLTGEKILFGKTAVNRLMAQIESAVVNNLVSNGCLEIQLVQHHRLAREIVPTPGFTPRSKLRDEAYPSHHNKIKDQWGRITYGQS